MLYTISFLVIHRVREQIKGVVIMTDLTKSTNYFRRYITDVILENKDKKCNISGTKDNLTVHHLNISFLQLLKEAYAAANVTYRPHMINLTVEERKMIKEQLIKLHYEKAEFVTLSHSIHKKYHELNKNNISREQFDCFKKWCNKNKKRNHTAIATRRKKVK